MTSKTVVPDELPKITSNINGTEKITTRGALGQVMRITLHQTLWKTNNKTTDVSSR